MDDLDGVWMVDGEIATYLLVESRVYAEKIRVLLAARSLLTANSWPFPWEK